MSPSQPRRRFSGRPILLAVLALAFVSLVTAALLLRGRGSVELVPTRTAPVIEAIYGLGTVRSERDFEVRTAVSAKITRVHVSEGEAVRAGQLLMSFDDIGPARAPFAGVVTLLPFHVADTVFPQQTALRLEDLAHRYVEVSVEQRGALRIRKGQPVRLVFESVRGDQFSGKVSQIYPRAGDFIARIEVGSLPEEILPGMTTDVAIEVARAQDVLLVPSAAVSNGHVVRERGGKREKVSVKLGASDGSWMEVREGDVRSGDLLVVRAGRRP